MRKLQDKGQEHTEVLDAGPIQDVKLPPPASVGNPIVGSALDKPARGRRRHNPEELESDEDAAPPPERHYYRVVKGGPIHEPSGGYRSRLKEGKVIDDVNYNIEALTRQGIKLEQTDGPEVIERY